MPPSAEQKRKMRIARKKRKKLARRETRKAQHEARYSKLAETALAAAREEANRHRELASKYYKLWTECAKQKKEIAKLWGKKRQTVNPSLHFVFMYLYVRDKPLRNLFTNLLRFFATPVQNLTITTALSICAQDRRPYVK